MTSTPTSAVMAHAPATPRTGLNSVRLILAAALLIFGGWTSLRYSFGNWAPDADIAAPIALWQGVSHYGLGFLASWQYTQDNWLFSLVLPTLVIYSWFGTNPMFVVGIGWLIFIASVVMTSHLVDRIAGRRAAFVVAVVLLFANYWTLGTDGFLSYPVTHNTSMAWALLILLLALRAIERTSLIGVMMAAPCVFIAAVSDPWAGPAIALPLICVSAAVAGLNWRSRRGRCRYAGALCAATAMAFLAARTRLFGVLYFLPPSGFTFTSAAGLILNVGWMFRAVATMFNIVPHTNIDNVPANVFDFLAFATILISAITLTVKVLRQAPIAQQLVGGTAIVSIAGISGAFVLGQWNLSAGSNDMYVGRFFPNLYYLGVLLAVTAATQNWHRLHVTIRMALVTYGLLYIASGLASYPRLWTGQAPIRTASNITDLGAFLAENGLTYGYGPYWGSDANAMNWMTGGRVTIRPVSFDPYQVGSNHPEASKLWFLPDDEPAGTPETFLVINDDGENCPSVTACVATAIKQFGTPSRRLTYENSVVLVWPNQFVSQIAHPPYTTRYFSAQGDYRPSAVAQNWMWSIRYPYRWPVDQRFLY